VLLFFITLAAAVVNGALGYGFSSITVPLALLFLTNRILNPALVIVEVALNAYVLWVNRRAVAAVRSLVQPITFGLLPGVAIGTLVVSVVNPSWLRLATFVVLLPLILLQAAGYRRPIRAGLAARVWFGGGIGTLYAVTTISGPPLALALNNEGLSKQEFRAALGFVRIAESGLTLVASIAAGLVVRDSIALVPQIVPAVAIGVPIGAVLIRRIEAETFRRICMSFDAWIVAFGIATLIRDLRIAPIVVAYIIVAAVVALDAWLLYRFFRRQIPRQEREPSRRG
jgi:uncharacterized protein